MNDEEDGDDCSSLAGGGFSTRGGGRPPPKVSTEQAKQLHGNLPFIIGGRFHGYRCVAVGKNGKPRTCLLCGCLSTDPSSFDSAMFLKDRE